MAVTVAAALVCLACMSCARREGQPRIVSQSTHYDVRADRSVRVTYGFVSVSQSSNEPDLIRATFEGDDDLEPARLRVRSHTFEVHASRRSK